MLKIVEILRRSDQGMTRPYLCRCDDDRLYYVKGRDAGPRSLLCEWLAGHLAQALDLPVPVFGIAQAPEDLVDLFPDGNGLGTAPAFASLVAESAQELSVAKLGAVPVALQRGVLVFDWWVHNQDRCLTTINGNPNLLWSADGRGLVVFDHNLAFDREFDARRFAEAHVFSGQIPKVFHDLVEQAERMRRLRQALAVWPDACHNAPEQWWFMDEERTVPTDFDPISALSLLNRCLVEDFWRLPP